MEQDKSVVQRDETFPWLDNVSDFLDSKYRIPFTNIRFGADFLIGLIPYGGDVITFGMSGFLVLTMAKNGASGKVVLKMLGNIILDALVGAIPILGDIFDLTYRANRRNFRLLKEHYQEGQHQGNAWGAVLLVLVILIAILFSFGWLFWKLLQVLDRLVPSPF